MILIILISLSSVKCSTTNNLPKALNQRSKRILIGVGAAVGLTGFKLLNDGPVFDESTSLNGKVIAITGGNTGLGKEAAIKLASLGAQILILSRPSAKTDAAVNEIKQLTGNNNIQSIPLDLSDLSSVTSCAREVTSKVSKLDVLMNNAGVMAIPERETTRNGFEKQLGVNHLGHFLLTSELMPLLKKAGKAR